MPKHLIPPVISKPAPLLSTAIDTHNPWGAESSRVFSDDYNALLVLRRESFLHNLVDFLGGKHNIKSLVYPLRSRNINPFAPIS